jgi:hypothetical protein
MVVEGGAGIHTVQMVLRKAHGSARCMVEESVAHHWDALKRLMVALNFARAMVEASSALFRVVACAQIVCVVGLNFVLHMAVARGVLSPAVPIAPEGAQITVWPMEVARDASLRDVA